MYLRQKIAGIIFASGSLCLIPSAAFGKIVNVLSEINQTPQPGHSGKAELSWDRRLGSSDISQGKFGLLMRHYQENFLTLLLLSHEQGSTDGEEYLNNSFAHFRMIQTLNQTWDIEMFTQADRNEFRLLNRRYLVGIGPRLKIKQSSETFLVLGMAYMYEHEELEEGAAFSGTDGIGEDQNIRSTNRISSYLSYKRKIDTRLTFSQSAYYQPEIAAADNYRLLSQTGFEFQLVGSLSYSLSMDTVFDSRPPIGVQKEELKFVNSLNYTW